MNVNQFKLHGKYLKSFYFLLVFSLFYIFPIVLANFYYIDDLTRSIVNYVGWARDARPLTAALTVLLNGGEPLMDISPLMQVGTVVFLDYAIIVFLKKFIVEYSAFKIFLAAALGYANLFLLENFSFKYDSFSMIVSLGIFLLLYAFPEDANRITTLLLSVLVVIISLCMYQASIGAYISLAVVESIYLIYRNEPVRKIFERVLLRIIGIGIGGIIYFKLIVPYFTDSPGYSLYHAGILDVFSSIGLQKAFGHASAFMELFKDYVISLGYICPVLILAAFVGIICLAVDIWNRRNESVYVKSLFIMYIMSCPLLLIGASIIALVILENPVYLPRALISVTVFTLFIGIILCYLSQQSRIAIVISLMAVIYTLAFSSSYGNLLYRQDRMDSLVASYLVYDMNRAESKGEIKIDKVSFLGESPRSRELLLEKFRRPLFDRLVPAYMDNDWYWGRVYLLHYKRNWLEAQNDPKDLEYVKNNIPVSSNEFYKLYLHGDKFIVCFPHQ